MKKLLLVLLLLATPALAQYPASKTPGVTPNKELTVIFKDVTQHDLFQKVKQALEDSKVVNPFVMTRATRGFIEFSGKYAGGQKQLLQVLHSSVGGKLHIQAKSKGADGLEILIKGFSTL